MADSALEHFARRVAAERDLAAVAATAERALPALAAAGVDVLVLKGPALAVRLARPGVPRASADLDLLVAPDRLDAARDVLRAAGFHDVRAAAGRVDVVGAVHAEEWSRPDDGAPIDLHGRLAGLGAPPAAQWAALWAARQRVVVGEVRGWSPGGDALALHVALHAAQHGAGAVRPLEDLALAVARWPLPRWRGAAALAERLDASRVFAAGLRLDPAGAALAEELGLAPSPVEERAIRLAPERPRGTEHLAAVRAAPTPRERARLVRTSLLPSAAWLRETYPWARGGRVVAARVVHLGRAPAWALRAWRHARAVAG